MFEKICEGNTKHSKLNNSAREKNLDDILVCRFVKGYFSSKEYIYFLMKYLKYIHRV